MCLHINSSFELLYRSRKHIFHGLKYIIFLHEFLFAMAEKDVIDRNSNVC